MAVVERYQKEPNLFDIPLYRQRLSRQKEEEKSQENEKSCAEYTDTASPRFPEHHVYGSATLALNDYIKDFEKRPADTLLAVHYGSMIEHISVPCPRPAMKSSPERNYLPSVTELLASDSRIAFRDLPPTPETSPTKSTSPRQPLNIATSASAIATGPVSPMKGIFWEVSEESRPKKPNLSLSPIKPSPFDKLTDLSLPALADADSIDLDAKCDTMLKRLSTSPQKQSPYTNLVDLSIPPLADVELHEQCESVLRKYESVAEAHRYPSWIEDLESSSTASLQLEKQYRVPEWVKELQDAESSDVLSIIEKRLDNSSSSERKPRARILPAGAKGKIRGHLLGLSDSAAKDDIAYKPRSMYSTEYPMRRHRTRSEDRFTQLPVPDCEPLKEKSLSWTSVATSDCLEKELAQNDQFTHITDKLVAEVLNWKPKTSKSADDMPSIIPSDSVSCAGKKAPSVTWGRPMERLKNLLFTVQHLDSVNEKAPSYLDDKELAQLAQNSVPLKKALEHLSNVRDIINSSPKKEDSKPDQPAK